MESQAPRPRHRWAAFFYDRFAEPAGRRSMEPLRRFATAEAHGRVLEVGAGTGANLPYYDWSRIDRLDLTEPDPFMLGRMLRHLAALPPEAVERIRTHEVPAESLPFAEDEFDSAVVTLVLCTVADPRRSADELRRVLKRGAEARFVEHVGGSGVRGRLQRVAQPAYGWFSGGCNLNRDTEATLRDAGFDLEVTQRTSFGPLWPAFAAVARKP
jgi:SAM-dependent methyltransferase